MKPLFEEFDSRVDAGYDHFSKSPAQCCEVWLEAWQDFTTICDREGITRLEAFDRRFGGRHFVFNWVQDLEQELHNAGLADPKWVARRREFCAEFLGRFGDDALMTQNMRRALAESMFELGEVEETNRLYREWLNDDPDWGWGWIGWSDCYWLFGRDDQRDPDKADAILQEGLAVEGVRDRADILERRAELCEVEGKEESSAAMRQELARLRRESEARSQVSPVRPRASSPIRVKKKVGRNDPCPCGSGKKLKKCCVTV